MKCKDIRHFLPIMQSRCSNTHQTTFPTARSASANSTASTHSLWNTEVTAACITHVLVCSASAPPTCPLWITWASCACAYLNRVLTLTFCMIFSGGHQLCLKGIGWRQWNLLEGKWKMKELKVISLVYIYITNLSDSSTYQVLTYWLTYLTIVAAGIQTSQSQILGFLKCYLSTALTSDWQPARLGLTAHARSEEDWVTCNQSSP